jgi:hypothetical protein
VWVKRGGVGQETGMKGWVLGIGDHGVDTCLCLVFTKTRK